MKKFLTVIAALLLLSTFTISSFAASEETYVYEFGNVSVIFDAEDTWDVATRETIAYKLVYGEDDSSTTYNLLCTMFGHKYETRAVTTVTHCVLEEQPRCLEEYFDVSLCSRCEDSVVERIGYCYITCCP